MSLIWPPSEIQVKVIHDFYSAIIFNHVKGFLEVKSVDDNI